VTIFIYLFGNLVLPIVLLVLGLVESTQQYANKLRWVFLPLPIYDVGKGFYEVLINDLMNNFTKENKAPLSTEVAGYYMYCLILSIPFYWFLLFLVETRILSTVYNKCCGNFRNRRAMNASLA